MFGEALENHPVMLTMLLLFSDLSGVKAMGIQDHFAARNPAKHFRRRFKGTSHPHKVKNVNNREDGISMDNACDPQHRKSLVI